MKNLFETNKIILSFFIDQKAIANNFNHNYLNNNNLLDYNSVLIGINKADYDIKLNETAKIINVFNKIEKKTGIPYYTMKSFLSYPYIDHDIDFIITNKGYGQYITELKNLGFYRKRDLSNIREPMKQLYKHKDYLIKPHIHSEISWNGIITCNKEDVFKNAIIKQINRTAFRIPSNTDELLIAIGHFLFENYHFKLGELIYFEHLLKKKIDYTRIETIAKEYGYSKGVALFFNYLKAISDCYKLDLNIPQKYIGNQKIYKNKMFPYYIPYQRLIPVYAENFYDGAKKIQIVNLFRKLFTYTLVGYLWKYLLQLKRQKKFLSQFRA